MRYVYRSLIAAAALAVLAGPLCAQEIPIEGPAKTTALIHAQTKSSTQFDPAKLKLEVDGHTTPIAQVQPVRSGAPQVAILIDDGLRGSFGNQIKDVQSFITGLPAGVEVMVGYMENGTVRKLNTEFTTSHEELASHVRVPLSAVGISASPYFCLSDFVKHWPSSNRGARFVLMITNGVDPYNGSVSILNQDSPYVRAAQEDAQRAGVAVYSIYFGDRAEFGHAVSFSGQSYLQQVADATGGESFYQGLIPPVTLKPYLDEFQGAIADSYVISFQANATHEKSHTLTPIKVGTSQHGVKIHAPHDVHPGVDE